MSGSSSARISISSDEVNLLVYRYLVEAGFKHSSFVFHGESLLQRSPNLLQADLPPGTLVTLLQKALLFMYAETHVSNDGKAIKCDEVFSLLKPHDHDHGPIEAEISNDSADHHTAHQRPPSKKQKATTSSSSNSNHIPVGVVRSNSSVTASSPVSSPIPDPTHDVVMEHTHTDGDHVNGGVHHADDGGGRDVLIDDLNTKQPSSVDSNVKEEKMHNPPPDSTNSELDSPQQ